MIRIAGGWYCDAEPHGAYVALVKDSHLETDAGRVELPQGQNLLYVRIAPDGLRFAGVGHRDDFCWQWNHILRRWDAHGLAFGPRAVSYTDDGALQVVRHAPAAPTLHDRDRQIHEYTELPGLTIGHGGDGPHGEDPAIALMDSKRHLIEEGQCRFINVRESGRLSMAYVREDTRESVIRWMTRDEIAQLPTVGMTAPNPGIPPAPLPEPAPMSLPDPGTVYAALARERAKYPERVNNDQCGAILNAVALLFPFMGMHRKDGGAVATLPNGVTVNRNVLRYLPPGDPLGWWADVLGSAGVGIASPQTPDWQRSSDGPESFVKPFGFVDEPEPEPDDPPPAGDLEARVDAIERWIRRAL